MTQPTTSTGQSPFLSVQPDGLGWLTFDDPHRPVNLFDGQVMAALADCLRQAQTLAASGHLRVLVLWSGKTDSFFAGADVAAIEGITDPLQGVEAARAGQAVFQSLASLPIPTVAAIHGVCVGGGVEMALACHRRILSDSDQTRLGCPEVLLGILPAWGGTTRLPRMIGLRNALSLILSGRRSRWDRALAMGLADEVRPAQGFRSHVAEYALKLAGHPLPAPRPRPVRDRILEGLPLGRRMILAGARRRVMERTEGHYPAPLKVLEVVEKGHRGSMEESLALEAEALARLIVTPVSKNLLHVFHLREDARKSRGIPPQVLDLPRLPPPGEMKPRPVNPGGPVPESGSGDTPPIGEGMTLPDLVARILAPFLREGLLLREEGFSRGQIDGAARAFGMAAGPFQLMGQRLRRGRGAEAPDPLLVDRLLLPMVNEAADLLAHGPWRKAGTVDLALILGGGFPPFRGGLLRHADEEGLEAVGDRLQKLADHLGPRFRPGEPLMELIHRGQPFYRGFP